MKEMVQVMKFTDAGLTRIQEKIESLRSKEKKFKGSQGTPISPEQVKELQDLAFDKSLISVVAELDSIDTQRSFATRFEMAVYLNEVVPEGGLEHDDGLWTWLSVVFIDQLLKTKKSGEYMLMTEYRYIPNNSRLRFYRHLVRTGWKIYQQYGEDARLFLSRPPHQHSDFVEQSQKTEFISNPHMVKACLLIFYDEDKKEIKPDVSQNTPKAPGSVRRLVSVVFKQLAMNYDLYEMPAIGITSLLPRDYDHLKEPVA